MKFHEYLESTYVSTNLANQKSFSPKLQAKTHAVQHLINVQRAVYRWQAYPTLLFGFLAVLLGLKAQPPTAEEIAATAFQTSQAAKEKAKAEIEATKLEVVNLTPEVNAGEVATH